MNGKNNDWQIKPADGRKYKVSCEDKFIIDSEGDKFNPNRNRTSKNLSLDEAHDEWQSYLINTDMTFDLGYFDEVKLTDEMKYDSILTILEGLLKHIDKLVKFELIKLENELNIKFKEQFNIKQYYDKMDELRPKPNS